ncbi:degenerin mec-4, partial [Aphelenchoides avenae]
LKMIVVSNASEYLMTSSLQGVKIVVHPQETHRFPNGQGYMASVGQQKGFIVTMGCLRSCFQHNVIAACGCADPRFPYPEEDGIEYCTPLDSEQS